jgi:hypothetical protein
MNTTANSPSAHPDLKQNYVEAGVDGLIHEKSVWASLKGFGQANPLRIIAMCIVYWLIVWPDLTLIWPQDFFREYGYDCYSLWR